MRMGNKLGEDKTPVSGFETRQLEPIVGVTGQAALVSHTNTYTQCEAYD